MSENNRRRGRPQKPYVTSRGEIVPGLRRRSDGRWLVVATGDTFVETDEMTAVARYRQWLAARPRDEVALPVSVERGGDLDAVLRASPSALIMRFAPGQPATAERTICASQIWPWLRRMLLEHPEVVARETGIPQLARLAELPLPREAIALQGLIDAYCRHSDAGEAAKRKVREAWEIFTAAVAVKTLPDVTVERFTAYCDSLKAKAWCAEYIADNFGRVRRVIRFALRRGMDPGQIRSALDRAAVLVAPRRLRSYSPSPIKVGDFQNLLKTAADDELMTAALLLSLNACLYAAELLDVEWDDLDLEAGTYLSDRAKTGIIRAAALWPRTVAALGKVPRTPGKVFKSSRGDAYHPNSFRKVFASLRRQAGVSAGVEYNSIRDGAYTAAVASGVPEQLARVLAGHKAPGLADHYIARNPRMTEPACQAVEELYFRKPQTQSA